MPSARRLRLLCVVVVAVFLTLLFTSRLRQASTPDVASLQGFYHKTKSAIDKARLDGQTVLMQQAGGAKGHLPLDKDADGDVDEDDTKLSRETADRLKAAEQLAKDLANSKSPNKPDAPSNVIGVGSSAGGQSKKKKGKEGSSDALGSQGEDEDSAEDTDVNAELDAIFRKAPVIIFSKSYCPFSQRAKGLLLEKYAIEPPPHIVELDTHPLGPRIQAKLAMLTGRKTVPNIIVNGKSIGGSDDIADLDRGKTLVTTITSLGGKRVSMKERFSADEVAS